MDRLLEALKRLADEPIPAAVEPFAESELREVERLSPRSTRLPGKTAASSPYSAVLAECEIFSSEQVSFGAALGEAALADAECDPWIELENVSDAEPSETWEAVASYLDEAELTTPSSRPEELESGSESILEKLAEHLVALEDSIDEEAASDIEAEGEIAEVSDDLGDSSEPVEEEESEPLGSPVAFDEEVDTSFDEEETFDEASEEESLEEESLEEESLEEESLEEETLEEDALEEDALEEETLEEETPVEEVLEKVDLPQATQPGWEWADEPYLELLNRITEHHSPGISRAIALTSVDDLPDRAMAVAGLAKAYAVTTGERVLVVSAARQSSQIIKQLGIEPWQGAKSDTTSDSIEIEKVVPTRHSQADFLNFCDLFPGGLSRENGADDPMLVTKWRGHYSLILLDTGPWGGSFVYPLARQCDATYVFLGLGVTLQETALDAITRMKRGGIRVSGCVLTGERSGDSL